MTGPFDFSGTVLLANMNTFAEVVTYTPDEPIGSPSYSARGVFDEAYQELVVIDGEAMTVRMPVLGIKLDEFATFPRQNDYLVARNKNYRVREVRVDSHGGAKLMLNRFDPEC